MATYPPATASIAGDSLTASRFLSQPAFVARRLQTLIDLRMVGLQLLRGRAEAVGGGFAYEQAESSFAESDPEIVAPGAEYTLTTVKDGPAGLARVAKFGKDTIVTDESIRRRNMDPVEKGLLKLANSAGRVIDSAVLSTIASAVTANGSAAAKWNLAGTTSILQDIMLAQAAITGAGFGYQADTLLVDDATWAYVASNANLSQLMARENLNNPVYTGRFSSLAGLDVVHVPTANMPGGVGTSAWVLDSRQLGFVGKENLGGNYQQVNEVVESKTMRVDENDAWRLRVRANFVPVVTDPAAAYQIKVVA